MKINLSLLDRESFGTNELMLNHPPRFRHPNKQLVFDIACPPGAFHLGKIEYSRWQLDGSLAFTHPYGVLDDSPIDLKQTAECMVAHEGFYNYLPFTNDPQAVEWHVNFADANLFGYYSGGAMAQDELQVAEHPSLAALRIALLAKGLSALTIETEIPTPVLAFGVERRCHVSTHPNAAEGRPHGIYGRRFREADADMIRQAVSPIEPPTISNIIAIAAPAYGHGLYEAGEIEYILATAAIGFGAAINESLRLCGPEAKTVVHTGFWGAGAFGGNRVMMVILQAVAASLAGVHTVVFHTDKGAWGGNDDYRKATQLISDHLSEESTNVNLGELIKRIAALGIRWGRTDNN